jgi:hypothetical protein
MPQSNDAVTFVLTLADQWLARALGVIIKPPPKLRLPTADKVIGSTQVKQVQTRLKKMPEKEVKRYEATIDAAKSDEERDYLAKSLASNHSVDEIETFAKKIKGKDAKWMQDNLKLTSNTSGRGVKQQWSMSCNATTVQAVQAELDPIYALKLHQENKDLTTADNTDGTKVNTKLAEEQKAMLETKYAGSVKGAVGYAGKAVARDGQGGAGRWADDLLNARSKTTGLKYSTTSLSAKDYPMDKALKDLDSALSKGRPVPLVIGDGGASANAHYVLATQMDEGPPKQYTIHDPWDGITVTRSAEDLSKGKINLAGWNQLSSMELPSEAN